MTASAFGLNKLGVLSQVSQEAAKFGLLISGTPTKIAGFDANLKQLAGRASRGVALLAASEAPHYDTSEREVQYWSIIMHYARGPKGAVCVLAAGLLIGLVAPTVRAADAPPDKPFEEPGITYMQRSDAYIQWIAGSLFIAACLLIAFKNPHRSHLD